MADHDRDAGSRGEEEAPRDPTLQLRYGEQADQAYVHIPPTRPSPPDWEPSFGDYLRRKKSHVMGAGIIGLVVGGLLGGLTVAAFSDPYEDHARYEMGVNEPGWAPRGELRGPVRLDHGCFPTEDGTVQCVIPPPPVMAPDAPDPAPAPTRTS
jgi:hypothetical protein